MIKTSNARAGNILELLESINSGGVAVEVLHRNALPLMKCFPLFSNSCCFS